MQLRQLTYLIRIVEEGSFSRASQSLHIAQPALSNQISQLETELGVQLLSRSVRGVTPTPAGTAVARQAQVILRQVDATRLIALQADSGPAGPVAIGLPWTIGSVVGLALLQDIRAHFPAIQLEIVEGPSTFLANLLARGKLDLAVVFDDTTDGGLEMTPLVAEPLRFIGPKGSLEGLSSISLCEMAKLPLLLLSRPNGIREILEKLWLREKLSVSVTAEINSPKLLIQAVEAGLGYSVLPSGGLEVAMSRGDIVALEIEDPSLIRHIYLSTSRLSGLSPAAEAVHSTLKRLVLDAVADNGWGIPVTQGL